MDDEPVDGGEAGGAGHKLKSPPTLPFGTPPWRTFQRIRRKHPVRLRPAKVKRSRAVLARSVRAAGRNARLHRLPSEGRARDCRSKRARLLTQRPRRGKDGGRQKRVWNARVIQNRWRSSPGMPRVAWSVSDIMSTCE